MLGVWGFRAFWLGCSVHDVIPIFKYFHMDIDFDTEEFMMSGNMDLVDDRSIFTTLWSIKYLQTLIFCFDKTVLVV